MSDLVSDSAGYLLDSHVQLWWWFDPERLSVPVQALLAAQAELERLLLLTADPQLFTFPCRTLW
jgi:hypothetical protein